MIARLSCSVVALVLVVFAAGCADGGGPTTPTGTSGEAFEVGGIVTDDRGVPLTGGYVTMATLAARPSVLTDASGAYRIGFTANPRLDPVTGRSFLARAEIVAEGYDEYWRNIVATSSHLVENFRLHRIKRITPGDSIVLSVTPDNGDCQGWLYGPCGRVRVTTPADGNLRVEAVPTQGTALPQLQVCCVAGNERYGNPVTIRVTAGTETWVEVGQPSLGVTTSESVTVKTSLEPL